MKPDLNKLSRAELIRFADALRWVHIGCRGNLRDCQTRLRKIERVCKSKAPPITIVELVRGLADYSAPAGKDD